MYQFLKKKKKIECLYNKFDVVNDFRINRERIMMFFFRFIGYLSVLSVYFLSVSDRTRNDYYYYMIGTFIFIYIRTSGVVNVFFPHNYQVVFGCFFYLYFMIFFPTLYQSIFVFLYVKLLCRFFSTTFLCINNFLILHTAPTYKIG